MSNVCALRARPDHAHPGELPGIGHQVTPGEVRPEDHVAGLGMQVDELLERHVRDAVRLDVAARDGGDQCRAARELGHLTGELAGAVSVDDARRVVGLIQHLDPPRLDDEEVAFAVPGGEQPVAVAEASEPRERATGKRRHLFVGEPGEREVGPVSVGHVLGASAYTAMQPLVADVPRGKPHKHPTSRAHVITDIDAVRHALVSRRQREQSSRRVKSGVIP